MGFLVEKIMIYEYISDILCDYDRNDLDKAYINPNLSPQVVLKKMTDTCFEFLSTSRTFVALLLSKLSNGFDRFDVYEINAFSRPCPSTSHWCYGGKFPGTYHGDVPSLLEGLLWKYFEKEPIIALPNPRLTKCPSTIFDINFGLVASKEYLGVQFFDEMVQKIILLMNGCKEKKLLKMDHKRSFCGMISSGMTTSSGIQVKDNRRAAIIGGSEPFTNSNSGLLVDEDKLGLLFAELQVKTLIINRIECKKHGFSDPYKIPRYVNPIQRRAILNKRVQHFKSLVGADVWAEPASEYLKTLTKTLLTLNDKQCNDLDTVESCFRALRFHLPSAGAVRFNDPCKFHFDLPGEVKYCPVTGTAIISIPLVSIENKKLRDHLTMITDDPEKKYIRVMIALYGRKCVEDYARTVDLEESSLLSEDVDVLTKLIALLLLEGKGHDFDHLTRFEADMSWTDQIADIRDREDEVPEAERKLSHRLHDPTDSCIFTCSSLDRFVSVLNCLCFIYLYLYSTSNRPTGND